MIVEMLSRPAVRGPFLRTLQRHEANGQNGAAGEERLVMSGVSWEEYLELDNILGDDRPGPRLYFLDGELEIMSTSLKHEELKKWLAMMVEDYLYESGIETFPHGQATVKILREAGAEPDESWCFGRQKKFPELVLEIALTSGGLNKLEIYRRFNVAEVWFWRKGALEIWTLKKDRSAYDGPAKRSRLLPGLNVAALTRCLELKSWREARRAFREVIRSRKR
jgi:Uma2 family endonuclease